MLVILYAPQYETLKVAEINPLDDHDLLYVFGTVNPILTWHLVTYSQYLKKTKYFYFPTFKF